MRLSYCVCEGYVSETPERKPHLLIPAQMRLHLVSSVAKQFTCSNAFASCFDMSELSSEVSEFTASMTYSLFFLYSALSFSSPIGVIPPNALSIQERFLLQATYLVRCLGQDSKAESRFRLRSQHH